MTPTPSTKNPNFCFLRSFILINTHSAGRQASKVKCDRFISGEWNYQTSANDTRRSKWIESIVWQSERKKKERNKLKIIFCIFFFGSREYQLWDRFEVNRIECGEVRILKFKVWSTQRTQFLVFYVLKNWRKISALIAHTQRSHALSTNSYSSILTRNLKCLWVQEEEEERNNIKMTVTYTAEVATCRGFGCFLKLLFRWEFCGCPFDINRVRAGARTKMRLEKLEFLKSENILKVIVRHQILRIAIRRHCLPLIDIVVRECGTGT